MYRYAPFALFHRKREDQRDKKGILALPSGILDEFVKTGSHNCRLFMNGYNLADWLKHHKSWGCVREIFYYIDFLCVPRHDSSILAG